MKPIVFHRFILVAILVLAARGVRAELVWERKDLALSVESGEPDVSGTFKVTNRGNKAVRILSVQPGCGCTIAKPERDLLAPSESTLLSAKVSLEGRLGDFEVSIIVTTDEPSNSTYPLAVKVGIVESVQMTPRFVFWEKDEKPTPKKVVLKLKNGIEVTRAEVQGESFSVKLVPGTGQDRVIWVTPVAAKPGAEGTLQIFAQQMNHAETSMKAFLHVIP